MQYLEILNKNVSDLVQNLKNDVLNDKTVYEFVKDKNELEKLLEVQQNLLVKYLSDFGIKEFDEKICYEFYKDLKIPYTIVFRSLNKLKEELIKILTNEELEKEEIFRFSLYFQYFLDVTAKVYMKKDVHSLRKLLSSPFRKYMMFKFHLKWIEKIMKCILEDNMDDFPIINPKECGFNDVLYYPESLMVCIDKNLCMYLYDLHTIIHKTANSFYLFYLQEKYSEAYFLFKDLKEQILKFSHVISELYFVTYSDLENSFFRLIELMEKESDFYVSMIDIKGLKNLNAIYGENVVTSIKNSFAERIKEYCDQDNSRVLFVKGSTNDYYLLNIGYDDQEIEKFLNDLRKFLKGSFEYGNVVIDLEFVISSLKVRKFSEIKNFEFIKILNKIKNSAKKDKVAVSIVKDNEFIMSVINEKYNEKFIIEKLKNGDIDVVFQPIYSLKDGSIYTLEVLGRIVDDGKLIPAGIFIDKIYEMNLIEKFDLWILEKLQQKKSLIKKVSNKIFVNVSFQSLLNKEYMEKLSNFLKNREIDIILELTEQKFVENLDLVVDVYKKYGVEFAVDDFGTGYSSLKTVVDLVKEGVLKLLKIDGSLVNSLEKDEYMRKIIKIISRLSDELELSSVAEFVENEEILKLLKDYKIDLAQGFYLSKPRTIEELIAIKAGIGEI